MSKAWEFRYLSIKPTDMLHLPRFISVTAGSLFFFFAAKAQSTQPLFVAIKNNDVKSVKSLLDGGTNLTIVDDDSDNALMSAAMYASPAVMKLLLKKGVKVNDKNKAGETALMWCVHDKDKVDLLLKNGADINASANSGNTPLLIACVGAKQYDVVKMLLDRGANPLAKNNRKETALMRAVQFGDTATISLLFETGIDINAKEVEGATALYIAIANSNRQAAIQLLELGANPDLAMQIFPSSLCVAAIFGDVEIVNAILKKTKSTLGIQASLMFAVYNEHDNVDIVRILIDKGANVNMRAPDGASVLAWAMKKGNTATVELLKQAGAK